jgi:tRNA(Arg) A34 adenosine deaminase TadA
MAMTDIEPQDAAYLRRAIVQSRLALERGNRPYGAVLVGADGAVLAEGQNTEQSERDITGHAETNALREAYQRLGPAALAGSTMYASGEPCPMCAATMFYGGVSRVVYAVSRAKARALSPQAQISPILGISSREILATSSRPIEVIGPVLEDEGAAVFAEAASR